METRRYLILWGFSEMFKSYYVVWKLPCNLNNFTPSEKFKSYYVVWKPRGNDEICGKIFCLNRTMQYGNCHFTILITPHFIMFKSYYVVWKLPITIKCICWWKRFKSYYVVWKLPCFLFPSNPMISFKSYYVVWKLSNISSF